MDTHTQTPGLAWSDTRAPWNTTTGRSPYYQDDESKTVIYVSIPLVIIILCLSTVLILVIVRNRKRQIKERGNRDWKTSSECSVQNDPKITVQNDPKINNSFHTNQECHYKNVTGNNHSSCYTESEYYNGNANYNMGNNRNIAGVIEDDSGYGQFVGEASDGSVNYSYVADSNGMKKKSKEKNIILTDRVAHNLYNSLHDSLSTEMYINQEDLNMYDHATHMGNKMAKCGDENHDKVYKTTARSSQQIYYANVEAKNKDLSKCVPDSVRCDSIVYENSSPTVPVYLELEQDESDSTDIYSNCNSEEKPRTCNLKTNSKVQDVTFDDTECDDVSNSENHVYFILEKEDLKK